MMEYCSQTNPFTDFAALMNAQIWEPILELWVYIAFKRTRILTQEFLFQLWKSYT